MKEEEKIDYDNLISSILQYFNRLNFNENTLITVSGGTLSTVEEQKLPSVTYGSTVTITSTIQGVNEILRSVYYYASVGTYGTTVLTVNVTDMPLPCTVPVVLQPASFSKKQNNNNFYEKGNRQDEIREKENQYRSFFFTPLSSLPLLPQINASNANVTLPSLCNTEKLTSNTVSKSVNIYIVAVNQAPEVVLTSSTFAAVIGTSITAPTVSLYDIDHLNTPVTYDSFGYVQLPPISVIFTVITGRISFSSVDGVSIPQGTGKLDRITSLRGPVDKTNLMVKSLTYICRVVDGCVVGKNDSISIVVNDEGYVGLGGPLTANATIIITL